MWEASRVVIKFDLTAIPKGSTISGASLTVWAFSSYANLDRDVMIHPLNRSFEEHEVTWNNATDSDTWTEPGGDFDISTVVGSVSIDSIPNQPEPITFELDKDAVQDWVTFPSSNHGFIVKMAGDETVFYKLGGSSFTFFSSEFSPFDDNEPPLLEIYYQP